MANYVKDLREIVGTRPLILPGALVLILNEKQEILLQKRPNGVWGLPGGLMELGESLEETGRREVKEETGLEVGELRLVHVFSGEDFHIQVANGDEFYAVTAVYVSTDYRGQLTLNSTETLELRFFALDQIPQRFVRSYRIILDFFMKHQDRWL
ncbi:NUDIX hydrolase [Alkalihalobacillus pseudalcaliphilus]|uniref:NUDIX hydrolase n=1 Tax=Alkalihalobacillus pseudalcaliphilus TaxID=79884 RepID=UPI00064D91F1|nr:NUDIX hydrolase [Alkalihalobacillus pseudalcaliphilus]KMK75808.1 DNA mismatch repair protein MutT [Alkalihalobacillus pseudalcaliphilus]